MRGEEGSLRDFISPKGLRAGEARARGKEHGAFGRDLERSGEFHEYCDPDTGPGMDDKHLKAEPAGQRQHRREA